MKKIIIVILVFINFIVGESKEKIVLANIKSRLAAISIAVLEEAYRKTNYDIEFIDLPPARGLLESDYGLVDGEVHRIKGIEKKYSNLIFIDVSINYFELRIYSRDYNFYINSKDTLKNYSIAATNGVVIYKQYLEGLNAFYASDNFTCYKILNAGSIDLALSTDIEGHWILKYHYPNLIMLEPALKKVKLYHYLHKSKAHVVPEITAILEKMEKSGKIERIRNEILNQ